jgi:hypothetical protein
MRGRDFARRIASQAMETLPSRNEKFSIADSIFEAEGIYTRLSVSRAASQSNLDQNCHAERLFF